MKRVIGRIGVPIMLAASLFAGLAGSAPPASAGPIDRQPRTDGTTIVYRSEISTISARSTAQDQAFTVVSGGRPRQDPDVAGNVVVWSEGTDHGWDIRAKRLAEDEVFDVATAPGDDLAPSISGTRVVWLNRDASDPAHPVWKVMTRDIANSEEPQVLATLTANGDADFFERPAIAGDKIVWGEVTGRPSPDMHWALWATRLGVSPFKLAEGGTDAFLSGYDVGGAMVVYSAGTTVHWLVLGSPGADQVVTTNGDAPTTDGRYVFWHVFGTRDGYGNEIHGYDTSSDSLIAAPFLNGLNAEPWTRGGELVWVNGTSDLASTRIAALLPSAGQPDPGTTDPNWTYYPETAHYLAYGFRDFWRRSGGLPVFGYPMTEEFVQHGVTAQYLERQRFEYHPEHRGTPYEVELGRLGYEAGLAGGLLDSGPFQPLPAGTKSDASCTFVPETGHRLCAGFRSYWQSHGLDFGDPNVSYRESLALFGYPLSEEFVDEDTGLVTQYFERAVFEYHPGNPEPYTILLKRLGAEHLERYGW